MAKIAAIGLSGQSIFMKVNNLPTPSTTIHSTNLYIEPGGKGYNQAVACKKLGAEVSYFSKVGCDEYGNICEKYLKDLGIDINISKLKHNDNDDYPDFAFDVCKRVVDNKNSLGILICGTGIGMSIAANKVKGIRAARCVNTDDAFFARNHNDSNVLCISSNNDINNIYEIVDTFLNTKTSEEERHHKRVQKIINYENGEYNEL